MFNSFSLKMALRNLKTHHQFYVPFVLSTALMGSCTYIMMSLLNNDYVLSRHASLPMVMKVGVGIVSFILIAFMIYGNQFVQKNRHKEFGLYSILGLERKHHLSILAWEHLILALITTILSIIGGYLLGNLCFMLLNRLMRDTGAMIHHYPFDWYTFWMIVGLVSSVFAILLIINSILVFRLSPAALFNKQNAGEREPKASWLLGLLGVILIGAGYYIALTVQGTLASMTFFIIAIILVIFGTEILFTTGSILILKWLKANKRFYYRPQYFIGISGMLYRMKSNGLSLATLCVLCTGIIISIGTTLNIYWNAEAMIDSIIPSDYRLTWNEEIEGKVSDNKEKDIRQKIEKISREIETSIPLKASVINEQVTSFVKIDGNRIEKLQETKTLPDYIVGQTVENYNQVNQVQLKKQEGKVYAISNSTKMKETDNLVIAGKNYQVEHIEGSLPANLVLDGYLLILPSESDIDQLFTYYDNPTSQNKNAFLDGESPFRVLESFSINLGKTDKFQEEDDQKFKDFSKNFSVNIESKAEHSKSWYEIDGGFLFLGGIIGTVLLAGMILILYYKQLSEGYADRKSIEIMKKVGLPSSTIKSTIRWQMLWLIFMPLFVAIAHVLVSSRIIYQLIQLFGPEPYSLLAKSFSVVTVVFLILYFVVYTITSSTYYRIVNS